jgi:pSer/pThr/pTyr-binding forkhead associated (FHA) protein
VITLTLLHPIQPVPIQSWTFNNKCSIKIGRSTNNEVVLYSAVVSRHHVEIKQNEKDWEVVNLGANGTYIDGQRIDQVRAVDGMIIRLATSGPKILITIESDSDEQEGDEAQDNSLDPASRRKRPGVKDTLIS